MGDEVVALPIAQELRLLKLAEWQIEIAFELRLHIKKQTRKQLTDAARSRHTSCPSNGLLNDTGRVGAE